MSASAQLDDLMLREQVRDFIYAEHDLLDGWRLHEWRALFTDDGRYHIVTPGLENPDQASPDTNLFLVSDDQERLNMRIVRILKDSAHVEYPRSITSHLVSNIRIVKTDPQIEVRARFITFRTKYDDTIQYMGHQIYRLVREGGGLKIADKRCVLDLNSLSDQGKLSILL